MTVTLMLIQTDLITGRLLLMNIFAELMQRAQYARLGQWKSFDMHFTRTL